MLMGMIGGHTVLPNLFGILIAQNKETYYITSIMGWHRGIVHVIAQLQWVIDISSCVPFIIIIIIDALILFVDLSYIAVHFTWIYLI